MTTLALHNVSKIYTGSPARAAIRNISISVKKGEWLGVVGPNGSGKSTMLRILAGISAPTTGTVECTGTIVPVLGLATGFHGDLHALDNIRLGGMLMGLTKKSMTNRQDDILEFAGLTDFIHLPVKYFSTGMKARLALSLAVHIPADTLLLDEVFAVGDVEFRRKCITRLKELHSSGMTIILVSHNTHHLALLCTRIAYIAKGEMQAIGEPKYVLNRYTQDTINI